MISRLVSRMKNVYAKILRNSGYKNFIFSIDRVVSRSYTISVNDVSIDDITGSDASLDVILVNY